jgi:hypothetical protein
MFRAGPPYHPYKIKVLNHLLKSLVACEEAQLPPANFSGLLAPLLVHSECPWPWPYGVLALSNYIGLLFLIGEIEQRIIGCLVRLRETQGLRQLASYTCTPLVFSSLKVLNLSGIAKNQMI